MIPLHGTDIGNFGCTFGCDVEKIRWYKFYNCLLAVLYDEIFVASVLQFPSNAYLGVFKSTFEIT